MPFVFSATTTLVVPDRFFFLLTNIVKRPFAYPKIRVCKDTKYCLSINYKMDIFEWRSQERPLPRSIGAQHLTTSITGQKPLAFGITRHRPTLPLSPWKRQGRAAPCCVSKTLLARWRQLVSSCEIVTHSPSMAFRFHAHLFAFPRPLFIPFSPLLAFLGLPLPFTPLGGGKTRRRPCWKGHFVRNWPFFVRNILLIWDIFNFLCTD